MDVLVCVKRTPAVGAQILLTDDGRDIDTRHLGFTVGPHEECAVEEAVRIVERYREIGSEASATALTVGPREAAEQVRLAISLGVDEGVLVEAPSEELDPEATAAAIVAAVGTLAAEGRSFDLILFGNDSAVAGNHQVGIRVAHALAMPIVVGIKGIAVTGDRVSLRREDAGGVELYDVALPAAAAVKEGLNLPRYPTIKGRLRARKAVVRTIAAEPVTGGLRTLRLRRPRDDRAETVVLGHGAVAAPAVVEVLAELGVV